jgi:chromosome segregation ATPase
MRLAKAWQHWSCLSSKLHHLETFKAYKAVSRIRTGLRNFLRIGEANASRRTGKAFFAWRDLVESSSIHKELLGKTRQVRETHRQELSDLSNEITTLKGKQKELQVLVERLKRREDAYQQKLNKLTAEQSRSVERHTSSRNSSRARVVEMKAENEDLRAHVTAVEDNVCQFIEEMSEMLELQKTNSPRRREEDAAMISKLASGLIASSMRMKPKTSAKRKMHLSPSSSVRRK